MKTKKHNRQVWKKAVEKFKAGSSHKENKKKTKARKAVGSEKERQTESAGIPAPPAADPSLPVSACVCYCIFNQRKRPGIILITLVSPGIYSYLGMFTPVTRELGGRREYV
ncbi:hypothetical protein CCH79_00006700 [Gambusia affinis]|uniref:Uncharacterized protein n=1 Tax=Gambusia affinis TaxID=33528 RepID=A0A315W8K6_GAMAF|nr:hypothetical protein CCH79_00006700 [Gambusia affinis]